MESDSDKTYGLDDADFVLHQTLSSFQEQSYQRVGSCESDETFE